ncbi:MAG: arsenate reductase ArsC [Proteobacteria bacterium]|nr:arsenate reductase ArsC [Pseudomonadota bacterium]
MGILFICTHNACRSILCEVMAREMAGSRLRVASAGSHPAGKIHPLTLEYLKVHDYSTEGLFSKSLDEVESFDPDVVITVCDSAAQESCPVWLNGVDRLHWGLVDPTAVEGSGPVKQVAFDRLIRTIRSRMQALLD